MLLEPFMLLVALISLVMAPYGATHLFGAMPGLSLRYVLALLESFVGGLVAPPLILITIFLTIAVPVKLCLILYQAVFSPRE